MYNKKKFNEYQKSLELVRLLMEENKTKSLDGRLYELMDTGDHRSALELMNSKEYIRLKENEKALNIVADMIYFKLSDLFNQQTEDCLDTCLKSDFHNLDFMVH
jgi:hypothetical protein